MLGEHPAGRQVCRRCSGEPSGQERRPGDGDRQAAAGPWEGRAWPCRLRPCRAWIPRQDRAGPMILSPPGPAWGCTEPTKAHATSMARLLCVSVETWGPGRCRSLGQHLGAGRGPGSRGKLAQGNRACSVWGRGPKRPARRWGQVFPRPGSQASRWGCRGSVSVRRDVLLAEAWAGASLVSSRWKKEMSQRVV